MKTLRFHKYDGSDQLVLEEVPHPVKAQRERKQDMLRGSSF